MQNERPPTSARVAALDFTGTNGVKLVDIFERLHAGIRDIRKRLDTSDLAADDFSEAFETLIETYECLVALAVWIELRKR